MKRVVSDPEVPMHSILGQNIELEIFQKVPGTGPAGTSTRTFVDSQVSP